MERLTNGLPGPHESWEELAEHSLTHDQLNTDWIHVASSTKVEWHSDGTVHYIEADGTDTVIFGEAALCQVLNQCRVERVCREELSLSRL